MGHAAAIGHTTPWGGRRRIPRSAGSEGCCGAGRATPGHAVIASGCRRRTAPRDRRARTVRSPPHRLRGGRLWEQACRGSADSCETGRAIGRALAKKRRPRRLLRAAAARGSTRVPHRTLAKRGGCNGRARSTGAGLRHESGAVGRGRARPAGRRTALVRCLPVAARGRRPQCKARLQRPISSSLPRVRPYER